MSAGDRPAGERLAGVLNIRNGTYIRPPVNQGAARRGDATAAAVALAVAPAAAPAAAATATSPTSRLAAIMKRKAPPATAAASEDNRRWAHRRASASAGTLSAPEIGEPLPCVILDTSSTGARVKPHFARAARCQSIDDLPETFTLTFTMDRVAVDCSVAWRRKGEVGLKFISPARDVPKPVRMMAPAKGKK